MLDVISRNVEWSMAKLVSTEVHKGLLKFGGEGRPEGFCQHWRKDSSRDKMFMCAMNVYT